MSELIELCQCFPLDKVGMSEMLNIINHHMSDADPVTKILQLTFDIIKPLVQINHSLKPG